MGGLKYSDVEVVYLGFPEHLPAFLEQKGSMPPSATSRP